MTKKSLWGDLRELEEVKFPKNHLQEQARLLSEATDYVLNCEVPQVLTAASGNFVYQLDIIAPALNSYSYTILEISHGIDPYPLRLTDFVNQRGSIECKDEESFLEMLGSILSSTSVRRIIELLLSQSKS